MQEKINKISLKLQEIISDIQTQIGKENFDFKDFYFAGGCIYCLWNDKDVKDYDIFCSNKNSINKLKKYFKQNKSKANIITNNAITMGKYQFVIKHIGKPEIEVNKFDFKHNMFYYDNSGLHNLVEWEHLSSNQLVFNSARARDVLNVITRIPKFVSREMEISQAEILNILELGTRPTKIFRERRSIKQRRSGKARY